MAEITAKLIGLDKIIANSLNATRDIEKAIGRELYIEGEKLIAEAKEETPVDTGALRASGHVKPPEDTVDGVEVQAGFGGPAAPYAKIVHDNPEAYHKPPTKYRYLIDPFNRRLKGLSGRITAGVRAGFK